MRNYSLQPVRLGRVAEHASRASRFHLPRLSATYRAADSESRSDCPPASSFETRDQTVGMPSDYRVINSLSTDTGRDPCLDCSWPPQPWQAERHLQYPAPRTALTADPRTFIFPLQHTYGLRARCRVKFCQIRLSAARHSGSLSRVCPNPLGGHQELVRGKIIADEFSGEFMAHSYIAGTG